MPTFTREVEVTSWRLSY